MAVHSHSMGAIKPMRKKYFIQNDAGMWVNQRRYQKRKRKIDVVSETKVTSCLLRLF